MHVPSHLPITFDTRGNARTRIKARRCARRLLEAVAFIAGLTAVSITIAWLVCTW